MGMFDDVPMATVAPTTGGGMFDDIPMARPGQKPADTTTFAGRARDVVRSIDEGGNRALAGLIGAPADLASMAVMGADLLDAWAAGKPYEQLKAERDARSVITQENLDRFGSKAMRESMAAPGGWGSRPEYKPQTTAGEYARTAAEFGAGAAMLPLGGGGVARNVIGYGVVPGLASEAAGQATEGTAAEPWARAGAALGAGVGTAMAVRPSTAERTASQSLRAVPAAERDAILTRAQGLLDEATQRGIPLSVPNAIDTASRGLTNLSDMQRHVEAMGGMRGFYARMPEQVEGAARASFDTMAPPLVEPSRIGPEISDAARGALDATPEGQALARTQAAVARRTSPDQAGQVIQREMAAVADQREAARSAQAARDYEAARNAPENVGIERAITVERPGEPIVTYPQGPPRFSPDAPAPLGPAPSTAAVPGDAQGEGLTRWLARNGGVPMEADTLGQDLNRVYVPGFGTLARREAPTWDQIRVRLAEEGWRPVERDGAAGAGDVRDWVMDRIHQERIGRGRTTRMEDAGAGQPQWRGQMADEYGEALAANQARLDQDLDRFGVPSASLHPDIRSRTLNAMMDDPRLDPLDAYEGVVNAMREPYRPLTRSTTVQEQIPDVRFGQVNPQAALDAIDGQLRTAKGDVASALQQVRRDLYGPDGQTDLSVEGLLHARERLDHTIRAAQDIGDGTKVRDLTIARNALDRELKRVPEVATADAGFAANSRPLEPFQGNAPLAQVTRRDAQTGRPQVPAEQVPSYLSGATASREFLANATPPARRAFEGRVLTEIVDAARRPGGDIDAEALRKAMLQHEDVLAQVPDVARRVRQVAAARDALSRLDGTLVGRLAMRDLDTKGAINALFPANPLAGSEREVASAMSRLSQRNPTAARQLVRAHAETMFNEMAQNLQSGPNAMGGAKFSAAYRGNAQQAANQDAAMRALPNGDTIADGFARFLDVLDATGRRQAVGSRTAYNAEQLDAMKRGNLAERGAAMLATGGIKLPAKTLQRIEEWRLGRNLDHLARLFSDPNAVSAFRGLLNNSVNPVGPMARLVAITSRDTGSGSPSR